MTDADNTRRVLPGSHRDPLPEAELHGPLDPESTIEVTLHLRRGTGAGADPRDIQRVRRVLDEHGVEVVEVDPPTRRVVARGPAAALGGLFGTSLATASSLDPVTGTRITHRYRTGELSLPGELHGVLVAVLGLDDRPQARPHLRQATGPAVGYTPAQLANVYAFPPGTDGTGQTIAIIELGGGYSPTDLNTFFGALGLGVPTVRSIGVDGAANTPTGSPAGPDAEVALDIEVGGGLAPGASIDVYFAPNTDRGFVDAVAIAAQAKPAPVAMSISWGGPEDAWTGQARAALDAAISDATATGITVCVAAGDSGSSDGVSGGGRHVDFPASSPHALACGGTRLVIDPTDGKRISETVWNDAPTGGATGGGVSTDYGLPAWQASAGVPDAPTGAPGRGVPDVAADADPTTGYPIVADGLREVVGGTSAVAPLWAALIARLAQALGHPLGLLQPHLYAGSAPQTPAIGFTDITVGNNGAYDAGPGWDACTGLGAPIGTKLLARLAATP